MVARSVSDLRLIDANHEMASLALERGLGQKGQLGASAMVAPYVPAFCVGALRITAARGLFASKLQWLIAGSAWHVEYQTRLNPWLDQRGNASRNACRTCHKTPLLSCDERKTPLRGGGGLLRYDIFFAYLYPAARVPFHRSIERGRNKGRRKHAGPFLHNVFSVPGRHKPVNPQVCERSRGSPQRSILDSFRKAPSACPDARGPSVCPSLCR